MRVALLLTIDRSFQCRQYFVTDKPCFKILLNGILKTSEAKLQNFDRGAAISPPHFLIVKIKFIFDMR
jgi:hypothetical protein